MMDDKNQKLSLIDDVLDQRIELEDHRVKSIHNVSILLFFLIIFLVSSILVLYIAVKSSENVKGNDEAQKLRICSSYINMVIKQNDRRGAISLLKDHEGFENYEGLMIKNYAGDENLSLVIFYEGVTLYELIMTDSFDRDLAEEIIDINDFSLEREKNLITLKLTGPTRMLKRTFYLRAENEYDEL